MPFKSKHIIMRRRLVSQKVSSQPDNFETTPRNKRRRAAHSRPNSNGKRDLGLVNQIKIVKGQTSDLDRATNQLRAEMKALEREICNLKVNGVPEAEIADQLNISTIKVTQLLCAGLEQYHQERDRAAERFMTVADLRYEKIYRIYAPLAHGYTEKVWDEHEDKEVEVKHPPDPVAARVVLKILGDGAKMHGLNKVAVTHVGADGGPIQFQPVWDRMTDEEVVQLASGDLSVLDRNGRTLPVGPPSGSSPTRAKKAPKASRG